MSITPSGLSVLPLPHFLRPFLHEDPSLPCDLKWRGRRTTWGAHGGGPQAHVLGQLGLLPTRFITTCQAALCALQHSVLINDTQGGGRGKGTRVASSTRPRQLPWPSLGAAGTFPEQVDIAVCEQHVQQLQVALHVPRAHPDHLRGRSTGVRHWGPALPQTARFPFGAEAAAHPASPLLRGLSLLLEIPGLTLKSCSSFSRNTWIMSRSK